MYRLWGFRSVILSPASQAALKTVVATCDVPPPTSSANSVPMITGAGRKPRSTVRSPIAALSENVPPGGTSVPSRRVTPSRRFVILSDVPELYVL
jgi:hypothetical protein